MSSVFLLSSGLSSATSLGMLNGNFGGVVTLGPISGLPLTVSPTPTPPPPSGDPAPTEPAPADPTPAPTVTITETIQPSGPSEVSGTVKLDGEQYLGLTSGMVLILLFVVAALISQLRRP